MFTEAPDYTENRRRRRSDVTEVAIAYQLEQVLQDFELECCLIVDDAGKIVATSPGTTSSFMTSLAGLLPVMTTLNQIQPQHLDHLRAHRPSLKREEITTCLFRAGGRRFYIGAVGTEAVMNEVAIFRAILGTRRIHRCG